MKLNIQKMPQEGGRVTLLKGGSGANFESNRIFLPEKHIYPLICSTKNYHFFGTSDEILSYGIRYGDDPYNLTMDMPHSFKYDAIVCSKDSDLMLASISDEENGRQTNIVEMRNDQRDYFVI
jgi:hypothetical protein